MKIKTSELQGRALNHVLAKIEGAKMIGLHGFVRDAYGNEVLFEPESDWSQGGPIIEREKIQTQWEKDDACWVATLCRKHGEWFQFSGFTPLIAAMRCYVASKLGDEVEVPEELK